MSWTLAQVALGGAVGAMGRYLVGLAALRYVAVAFPVGTLAVNVVGSFMIGAVYVVLTSRGLDRLAPLLITGVLGGFTTFSAFSLDAFALAEEGRYIAAGSYVVGTLLACLVAVTAAVALMRALAVPA